MGPLLKLKMTRLVPISAKAVNILNSKMSGNAEITIEKRVGKKVLFSSYDGKYCGWVDLVKDPDWAIVLKNL